MIDRLVADANAAIDFIRPDRADPPPLRDARFVLLPLQAVGELFAGAYQSDRVDENLRKIEELLISRALPLLTNDRGFDAVEGLNVLHW